MDHFLRNFMKMDMNAMMSEANPSSNFYFPNNKPQTCQPDQLHGQDPYHKQTFKHFESLCGIKSKK
jgi:hypothetical protein